MNLQPDELQRMRTEAAWRNTLESIRKEGQERLNSMLTKLANGVKFCSLCGGEGHEAKDCPWKKNRL